MQCSKNMKRKGAAGRQPRIKYCEKFFGRPLVTNRSIFHSEIHSSKNVVKLTDRQAKYLADSAVLEYDEKAN